jgi:hypothetical protein
MNRHGDPTGGKTNRGEATKFFNEVVLPYQGDECLTWPYQRNNQGRGVLGINGRSQIVSRLVCIQRHGPPPSRKHQAAHDCGKGHLACVTPNHINWKTAKQNQADHIAHGTSNRGERHGLSKLSQDDVRAILGLKGLKKQYEIAETYGVSKSLISRIHRGLNWKFLIADEAK